MVASRGATGKPVAKCEGSRHRPSMVSTSTAVARFAEDGLRRRRGSCRSRNRPPAGRATASATSSGEPILPSSVSAARRSSCPGSTRDRAGRDSADPNLGGKGACEDTGEHRLSCLRGRMRGERRPRLVGRDVLDHDDEPTALTEVRRRGLRDEEAPLGRCSEREVPVGLGHLGNRLGDEAFSGGIHEQVEPTELLDGTFDERTGRPRPRRDRHRLARRRGQTNLRREAGRRPPCRSVRYLLSRARAWRAV